MSFPLTIPVSMPHHYVSSHYYGNVSPSYQVVSGQPVGQVPSTVAPIMMPPASTMDTRSLSLQDGTSPLVLAMSERTMPVRKQSVFVAPTGLSSLRPPSSRPSTSVSYVLTPPSPPSPSASHPYQPSPSYLTSSASMENLRTEWNSLGHPLDLSESSSPSSHHPVIQVSSGSRLAAPSKEDISQHISQIILKNKALMESFEPFFSHSRHQASPPTYSKRSMSTTQLPSSQGQPLVQSVITSSARASLASHYSFGAYQSPFDPQSASIRRYSSDVNPNVSAYSKLQSALLGEGKSTAEVANLPTLRAHPGRKYSEVPYQPQLHPESFKYPSQLNQAYLHSSKGAKLHKHSVILNAHDHLMEVFPLNESSRSSSEPSLVRNLLTSKTSPFAHLVPSEVVPNMSSTSSTNSNGNSDGSIIKDLLLKSRTSTHEAPPPIFSRSTPPPHKKSRTESGSGSAFEASCNHGRLSNSNLVFTCTLCNVPFRNRQNLEVHQKFYCRGSDTSSHKHNHNSDSMQTSGKRSHQESGPMLIPERKVSVLERPSIITYSNDSPLSSSLSTLSLASTSSGSDQQSQQAQQANSFGNILKSKLLSPGSEDHSSNHFSTPLKKRKISEPAYRYNYDSKHRDSYAKWHRVSVVQPPVLNRSERTSDLEMLPAYMPYLQTPATKITIKSPVLFPVLQNLIDTCTNHEFVVDDTYADSFPSPNLEEDKIDESEIEYLFESSSSHRMSDVGLLVKADQQSLVNEEASLEAQVRETINHLLDEVELSAHDTNQVATDLADVILLASPQASDLHSEVSQCVSDLIDSVANKDQQDQAECATLLETVPEKKISLARPTTLDLATRSYNQSARNEHELGTSVEHIRKISRLSIFVNRCSNQDEDESKLNHLIASTLVSPDTPRAKRKYQQLHINGNAYTNLGLKVTTRPTYCCIFRPQPMFVTQDSNPQLSMYSQWKNHPVPSGDVLELVRTPHDLMSAYDSQEAVFAVSRYRLSLVEVATAATMGGLEIDLGQDEEKEGESKPSGIVTREFLDKVSSRLTNYMSTNVLKLDGSAQSLPPFAHRNFERYLRALVISLGDGFSVRLADTYTRSQFILTHSSHHRLSQLNRNQQLLQQRIRKRSRSQNIDFYKAPIGALKSSPEMGIASNAVSSSIPYLSQSEQASRLPITESSSLKLPELANWLKPRKRSSTSLSATSLSSSTFSPFLTMHPMLGHLPAKSKQTVMYIMMMSQAPMSMAVPTVSSMISSKNLASRKFSECIGMKPTAIEENWAARIAADGSTEIIPKRIKIFEGGFKSNEDYTYVRGRGRGKYVCEECGIRCKKPSMLKKHIRTHTDLRPYSCRHCAFAFKTKGNLTKHMKSKAHHKKCVELGIIPVPTAIDDSQIDSDALAKQEQYELSCGSSGSFNQFADDDDDCDDDYDEEEFEDEDEEDDEGVPIPLIEQQRLTYIVPGQFDDAELDPTNETQKTTSHKSSDCSSTLSATSFSPRPKLSIGAVASAACNTVSSLSSTTSTLPLSIADIRAEQNDKSRKMSSSSTLSPLPMLSSMSNKMISSSKSDIGLIATTPNQQQTCAQSYHFAQDQLTTNSTSNMRQNITKEHEAEAARSLLILSGAAHNSELANSTTATAVSSHLTKSNVLSGDSENVLQSVYRSSISRKNSNLVDFNPGNQLPSERVDKTAISESEASLRPDRIIYEMASDRVLLAQNHLYPNESEQHRLTTDSRQSPVEMFRRTSQKVDRRTSQPTSVIISRSSPIECIEEEDRRKRIRHERSISESSNSSLQMHSLGPDGSLSVSPKSHNLLSISSLITSPTSSYVNTSPMPSFPLNSTSSAQLLQHQYALGVRNPRAAFIAEEIKRAIANSNESVIQQSPLMNNTSARMVPNSHSPPMMTYQRDNRQSPIPPSTNGGSVSALDNAALMQQQKLMHKIYENLKQSSPQLKSFQGNVNQYVLANAELSDQRVHLTDPSKSHSGLSLSSQIANNNLKMPISSQPIPTMNYLVPTTSVDAMKLAFNAYEKDSNKSRLAFQSMSERNVSQMTPSVARHFASSGNSLSSSSQHFSSSSNVPLPPPPSSPLPAPVTFDPSTVSKRSQSESDESDQPIDLSKTSVLSVSEPNIAKEAQEPTLKANNLSPVGHSSLESSPISPTQLAQNSPNRHRFRPLIEEKHLTEQLVRAFSPFSEMHSISFPKSPNQSHSNGREMYKNVRSEEFAHLAPGVHTPHRLPQNMLLLGARNNSSTLPVTSTSTLSGASLTRNPNSIPNAYTTAEGKSVCTICMKQFSKPSQLRLHINIHFFERPFRCDSCAVSFRTKGHLQKHSRSVSHLNKLNMNITFGRPSTDNPRPFKCSDCKIAFRIHGHLAKHLRSKMHIMKLECLGKLPFGMFAEMERSNINLTPIDTTDCEKALESLRSLAQKLYDPRQMCWKVTDAIGQGMDDVIEEDIDDDIDGEDVDDYNDDDIDMSDAAHQLIASSDDSSKSLEENSLKESVQIGLVSQESTEVISAVPNIVLSSSPPPTGSALSASSTSLSGSIASTRSNTCHLCGRLFKAAKFLQVHLYCDHPEAESTEAVVSSV